MALSLDDKLLGEKVHYYCSSSEDEGEEDDNDKGYDDDGAPIEKEYVDVQEPVLDDYKGYCTNTGPKGVVNDWRRFKQLENEKKAEQERERMELGKKLTLTCRTTNEDEQDKDTEFISLDEIEDEFIKQYRLKRLEEMRKSYDDRPTFGKVVNLTKETYIDSIDNEKANVTVIIHIYEDGVSACEAMKGCLHCLSKDFQDIKFCQIRASEIKLSHKFAETGVPALLVYKQGQLIGNFVRVSNDLGNDFFAPDVRDFLIEHGMLPDRSLVPEMIQKNIRCTTNIKEDSDSDFDID